MKLLFYINYTRMIECVYYNDFIRCYRDGSVERMLKHSGPYGKKGDWKKCELKPDIEGYIRISIDNKLYPLHRVIAFCFGKLEQMEAIDDTNRVDHINGIRSDNRIENLRQVTNQQNQWNQTKAKGYYWNKPTKKWKAQIYLNGKQIHLGSYDTEEEARVAYLRAKEIHHVI
jgi:hypothetical protein